MNIEEYMRPISDAARIVKASLPVGHGLELADLVSIGVERILRYGPSGPVLAFICAKQGMMYEARRWRGGRQGQRLQPTMVEYDDDWDSSAWRRTSALDVELLIDMKRALLAMRLREAVAWHDHHWLGEGLQHLEVEFGVSGDRIRQYIADAQEKLQMTWRGAAFETEEDRATRERVRIAARDVGREKRRLRLAAERRARYAELRAMGAEQKLATWACATRPRYLVAARQLAAAG